jgi:hypothetical protein
MQALIGLLLLLSVFLVIILVMTGIGAALEWLGKDQDKKGKK